jgi:hypothetical protein
MQQETTVKTRAYVLALLLVVPLLASKVSAQTENCIPPTGQKLIIYRPAA